MHADRFQYGTALTIEHRIHPYGARHHAHASTLREALSYCREALHSWAPRSVPPIRDRESSWESPKQPGVTRGHPRVDVELL